MALCLAASDKKVGKNVEKNHQKRGLLGGAEYGPYAEYQQFAAAPFVPSPQLIQNTNAFAPLPHAVPQYAPLAAAPLHHAVPQYAPAFQAAAAPAFAPIGRSLQYAPAYAPQAAVHGYAAAAPAYPVAAPVHQVPTHVNTVVKNVHVPYERHIKVDNPVHVPFERIQHIDNPVPVVKIVKQPYPVHVDEPVHIPVIKEVRVPAPYVHKVRLIIQRIIKDEVAPTTPAPIIEEEEKSLPIEAPKQYLPPTPQYLPPPPQQAPYQPSNLPQPIPHFEPAPQPNNKYGPPAYTPPAPHFEPAPQHNAPQQHFQAPAPQYQAPAPQQHFQAPAPQYNAPQQQFHAPSPPSTSYGHPERHQGYH